MHILSTRKQAIAISAFLVVVLLGVSATFIALNFRPTDVPPVGAPQQPQEPDEPGGPQPPTTPALVMPASGESVVVLKAANFDMVQRNSTTGWFEFELGFILGATEGTAVVSAYNGTVREVITSGNNMTGQLVRVEHANGLVTVYSSLGSVEVEVGQTVTTGQRIGTVGNTSYRERFNMPVVRFETFENGRPVNPEKFVEFPDVTAK